MKNNPKYIDVIVKYFFPVTAGIETNVIETYSRLAEKKWDITIHTSKDVYMKKNILKDSEEIRGLHVKRYPFTKFGYWPDIDWEKSDLVSLHNFDIFPHGRILLYALLRKLMGKRNPKIVLTPHGGYNPEWTMFPFAQRVVKRFYHYNIGSRLINAVVDGVRAVSLWESEEIIKHGVKPEIVTIISNGNEDEAYITSEEKVSAEVKKQVASLGRYIIQIGRIYPIKNYETTIKALSLAPSDLKYVIAGPIAEQKYYQSLLDLAKKLGLEDRVIFIGVVKGLDKYYFIRHASMMVHMAIWESFCNVVHEGLSQGLVCLVANNTALPYLVKEGVNGFNLPTTDWETLGKKITHVLEHMNDPEFLKMRENNKTYSLKNSWSSVSQKLDEMYLKVVGN